jgi:exonuclease SbcC
MIKSIKIQNFETHIKTHLDLHPGVNVIVGESDEGKSGIIRSIKWNAKKQTAGIFI